MNDYQQKIIQLATYYQSLEEAPLAEVQAAVLELWRLDRDSRDEYTPIVDPDVDYLTNPLSNQSFLDAAMNFYKATEDADIFQWAQRAMLRLRRNVNEYYMPRVQEDFDAERATLSAPWWDRALTGPKAEYRLDCAERAKDMRRQMGK